MLFDKERSFKHYWTARVYAFLGDLFHPFTESEVEQVDIELEDEA